MADESARRTPASAKILLGLILAVIVLFGVWFAYLSLRQPDTEGPNRPARNSIEQQTESPSTPEDAR